jgi:glycosyltransferase involved in cell wall biosynthesis
VKLGVVIPALDEEQSIASTIERTLAAVPEIIRRSPVTSVQVTVVSDGSTDRTVELARAFEPQIDVIVFDRNRGYGAAIKTGWEHMPSAELLAFLDADGTCDPMFFADLASILDTEQADIALGCRLNAESQMPLIRQLGNRMFALLLSGLASTSVRDTASGMRVVRRSALPGLMPLPDGLHFTPAMSARALLSGEMKVVETDMPYQVREGRSKLRVVRDGGRFLDTILRTAALYRPSRLLGACGALSLVAAALLFLYPAVYYAQHHRLSEWMIYRFVVGNLLGVVGMVLLCAGYIAGATVDALLFEGRARSRLRTWVTHALRGPWFWWTEALLLIGGGLLVLPSLFELLRSGATVAHWSRFIAMSLLYEIAAILAVTKVAAAFLRLAADRAAYVREQAAP